MRASLLVAVLVLVSGCVQGGSVTKSGPAGPGGLTKPPDLTTIEGTLQALPHIKVLGPTTIKVEFQNGTDEAPEVFSALVFLNQDFKSSHHGKDGDPLFVAFVPVNATDALSSCDRLGKDVRGFLRTRDTGNNGFGNLTGTFPGGWYHFVAGSDEDGEFSITFGSEKEMTPRKFPAKDPFLQTFGYKFMTGAREHTAPMAASAEAWFSWATHRIAGGQGGGGGGGGGGFSVDGGRTHTLTYGPECAKASRTSTSATIQNENRLLWTSAAGTQAGLDVKGTYQPSQAALAPMSTDLNLVWLAFNIVKPANETAPATP